MKEQTGKDLGCGSSPRSGGGWGSFESDFAYLCGLKNKFKLHTGIGKLFFQGMYVMLMI